METGKTRTSTRVSSRDLQAQRMIENQPHLMATAVPMAACILQKTACHLGLQKLKLAQQGHSLLGTMAANQVRAGHGQ